MTDFGTRQIILSVGAVLVLLAVIGAVYLEISLQSRAVIHGWVVTQDLPAGSVLTAQDVQPVALPAVGDSFRLLSTDPVRSRGRLAHAVAAQHLLSPDDLFQSQMVEVPMVLKSAPPLAPGDSIDVYAVVSGRTVLIGRGVTVDGQNGSSILVPASQESSWIALGANNVALFAARSSGIGVIGVGGPLSAGTGMSVTDALSQLQSAAEAAAPADIGLTGTP